MVFKFLSRDVNEIVGLIMYLFFKKTLIFLIVFFPFNVFSSEYQIINGEFIYTPDRSGLISRQGEEGIDEAAAKIEAFSDIEFPITDSLSIRNELYKESFTPLSNVEVFGNVANLVGFELPKSYYPFSSFHLLLSTNEAQVKNVCEIVISTEEINKRNLNKLNTYLKSVDAVSSNNDGHVSIQCKVVSK